VVVGKHRVQADFALAVGVDLVARLGQIGPGLEIIFLDAVLIPEVLAIDLPW
jgi:hypothetical protein